MGTITRGSGAATARLLAVVIDAVAPDELAAFWAHALGWDTRPTDDGAVALVPRDVTSFGVLVRPGARAKEGQNRIHFDLTTTSLADQRTTVADLRGLGARPIDIGQRPEETHVVLADPEANELCIIEPGNRFLASCPRLGAVNCDGTRALGQFYSAALGWPLVWDQDEETAIQAPDGAGPKVTWSGPPLMPRPATDRIHLHLVPTAGVPVDDALADLIALGASALETSDACRGTIPLADVDGNRFCLVPASTAT